MTGSYHPGLVPAHKALPLSPSIPRWPCIPPEPPAHLSQDFPLLYSKTFLWKIKNGPLSDILCLSETTPQLSLLPAPAFPHRKGILCLLPFPLKPPSLSVCRSLPTPLGNTVAASPRLPDRYPPTLPYCGYARSKTDKSPMYPGLSHKSAC